MLVNLNRVGNIFIETRGRLMFDDTVVDDTEGGEKDECLFDGTSEFVNGESKDIYFTIANMFPQDVGKAKSTKERQDENLLDTNLVYSEIYYDTFAIVIEKIKSKYGRPLVGNSGHGGFLQRPGGKFYDLGSGCGKPCLAAAILHNFDVCIGVEKLKGLYEASLEVQHAYDIKGKTRMPRDFDTEVRYVHGDMLARDTLSLSSHNWVDGDVVFTNSTCFDDKTFRKLADIAVGMKKGSFFITFSERLPVADFTVVDVTIMMQSWGYAKVYIMQKNTDPRLPDRGSAAGLVIEGEEKDVQPE